jgi:soluble lytic murein transglycosylase-like protein
MESTEIGEVMRRSEIVIPAYERKGKHGRLEMKESLLLAFLCFVLCASLASPEVLLRVDENGRKVFYNIPSKPQPVRSTVVSTLSTRVQDYTPMIEQACNKYKVDPDLVKAVIQAESAYNSKALSQAGAIGLMQLMPATALRFGVKKIHDPQENIHGGVQYLKFLLDRFNGDITLAVAAYNAGEGAVQRFKGVPRYKETQNYVKKVLTLYAKNDLPQSFVVRAKTIYRYADPDGTIRFTTARPQSGAFTEVKLTL